MWKHLKLWRTSHFEYLGSIKSNNFTLVNELNTQLGKAATSFGRLSKRGWSNRRLIPHTKLKACSRRPVVRFRDLDNLSQTGMETKQLPPTLPTYDPWREMAGQSHQPCDSATRMGTYRVCPMTASWRSFTTGS